MAGKQGDKSQAKNNNGATVNDKAKVSEEASKESPAQEIINAFGGLRPLANKLGIAVSTVQGWKERDSIPSARHEDILKAAAKANITLDVARLRDSDLLQNEDLSPASSDKKEDDKISGTVSTDQAKSSIPSSGGKAKVGKPAASDIFEKTQASETEAPAPESLPKAKKGGGLNSFFYGVGFCALAVAGIVFFRSEWLPLVEKIPTFGPDQTKGTLASLEERLDGLEQHAFSSQGKSVDENRFLALSEEVRTIKLQQSELEREINTLTSGGVVVTAGDADRGLLDTLKAELQATSQRISTLETGSNISTSSGSIGSTASSDVDSLKRQLATLSATVSDLKTGQRVGVAVASPAAGDVYLALGVLQLRDALRGSGPFIKELDLVRAVAPQNSTVQELVSPLSAFAASGLPSLTELRASFPAAAREAMSADKIAGGQTWIDKAIGRVTDVVSIRAIDVFDGVGTSSVLARAENLLEEGDLSGALRELEDLTSAAAGGMENWLMLAKQRQDGERISGQLALLLIGVTEQGSGVGGVQ